MSPETVSLVWDGHAEPVHKVLASSSLFSLLGVKPFLGRTFVQQDGNPNADHVAVISAEAWQRYFGTGRTIIGRNVDLNDVSYTIISVLPAGSAYPATGEFWMPLPLMDKESQASRVWHTVNVLGRLKPGIELGQAQADMQTIAARLAQVYPATNRNIGVLLAPLREQLVGSLRPAVLSLMGCVVLVLLIACANVANLLLARAAAHLQEAAVLQALGASRLRLFTQSLAETLLLCLLGGVLGTVFAALALPLLLAMLLVMMVTGTTTTRHAGYARSLSRRWLVEKTFGWLKATGPLRQVKLRGLDKVNWLFVFSCAAHNLLRLPRLIANLTMQGPQPHCA